MKKKLCVLLAAVMTVCTLAACASTSAAPAAAPAAEAEAEAEGEAEAEAPAEGDVSSVKIGFITLHDENSTYDLNFINAAKEACEKLGVEYQIRTNIPEGQECYDTACRLQHRLR